MPKPVVDFVDLFRQCSARTRIASPAWERDERGTGEWVTTMVYSQWFQDLVVQNLAAIETSMTPVARKGKSRSQPTTRSDGASLWSNSTEPQLFPSGTGNTVDMRYTPRVTLCKFLARGRSRWTVREGALGEKAATLSCCESEACPMTHLARRCCLRASLNLRPKSLFSSNPQCTTSTRNSSV